MAQLSVPQGEFELTRHPIRKNDTLRAWDAADEFLLQHLADTDVALTGTVVVVNDGSGALATVIASSAAAAVTAGAPASSPVVSVGDSYISQLATSANLRLNGVDASRVDLRGSSDPLPPRIDVAVVKVPKTLALLEEQLIRLAPSLHDGSVVVGAAMSKHVHTSTLELFERVLGPTSSSRARKKARLIFVEPDASRSTPVSAYPHRYTLDPGNIRVFSHAGVFSSERLDIGTSFLLDNLPDQAGQIRIVDLGCGNGVVGTVAAMDNPDADVLFIDESYLAVASAEATAGANLGGDRELEFLVGDGLQQLKDHAPIEKGSVDLIFNNPPFHDDHALSDATAWQMFTESHQALLKGGQLWVIGNRHLAYHAKLKRIFGNCDIIASDSKFVVFRATRK